MPDSIINERFLLGEKLGEGGMAIVYQATDLESRQDLALKLMKASLNGTSQRRFAREFRAIASVDHPNCIKVYEFAETDDRPFFTMELFPSQPITSLIGHELPEIFSALYQAASAIEYVHAQQIIHRDIKPSNLLTCVSGSPAGTQQVVLKLADFGLARFYGTPSTLSVDSGFLGTLAYSAPEQISSDSVDHRCDLYALGVVCYEVLTGRHPFQKARTGEMQSLIRAHLAEIPLPLRNYNSAVPAELEELVLSLLEKQPAKRPPTATSLKQLLSTYLGVEEQVTDEHATTPDRNIGWNNDTFVAREQELLEISGVITDSLSPIQFSTSGPRESLVPSVVFVIGDAGMGKSRLLREVARLAGRHGADVFEGRCFEGNLAPYQPFVEIVRQMLSQTGYGGLTRSDRSGKRWRMIAASPRAVDPPDGLGPLDGTLAYSSNQETVHDVIRNYAAELLRIAPELRTWLPGKAFRQVDLSREANYVLRAIATFFVDIAKLQGTCLLIEDLHWADQSSLDLLRHIASIVYRSREQSVESNQSYSRLFICCSARPNEAELHHISRELERDRFAKVVALNALNRDEAHQLVASVLGVTPSRTSSELIDAVSHRCHGNPYFITESISSWRSSGKIVRSDAQWVLGTPDDTSTDWPDSVRGVLRSRLESVTAAARQVLGPCAVIGLIIEVDVLRDAAPEISENEFLDAIDELLARQVLFETSNSRLLEFSHDLLRELAYEQLSGNRRRALHRRIGEVLEQAGAGTTSPEQLAGHFYEARICDRAFRYLLDAAEAALATYAIDDALRHLERAGELERDIEDQPQRSRLYEIAAAAYSAAGKPLEAIHSYEEQLELAAERIEKGRILDQIGKLYFRIGDFDAAIAVFDQALRHVGYRRPRSKPAVLLSTCLSFARHAWPRWLRVRLPTRPAHAQRLKIAHRVFSTLELLWAQRNVLHCAQAHGKHLVLADRIGDLSFLTHACARQALLMGIFSLNQLALRAGQRSLRYATQTGDEEAEAIAKGHVGCAHYFGARLKEGERLLHEAVAVLDRRGDSWERMYFYHNLRHLYSITGDAEREIECARVEMQIGEAVNDPEGTCWGAYAMIGPSSTTPFAPIPCWWSACWARGGTICLPNRTTRPSSGVGESAGLRSSGRGDFPTICRTPYASVAERPG